MKENIHISVVSPVYKAENIVPELVKQVKESVSSITEDFEIILVNDASPDNSWRKIIAECSKDKRVKGLNLSRNFGQHYAITAGLSYAKGDWVVVMDCDLQDRPDEIPNLYNKAQEGFKIVLGRRSERTDSFLKVQSSKWYYKLLSYLTDTTIDPSIGTYRLMAKEVVVEFNKMRETSRYFGAMSNWLGFKTVAIDIQHDERFEGKTTYNFKKSLHLALNGVLSFSDKPLRLSAKLGFVISFLSFLLALYNIVAHYIGIISVPGFTTTIFSIWFVGGLNLFVIGVIGLYIGKIFEQVKGRQLFIIDEKVN